jgi:hypothetical protein
MEGGWPAISERRIRTLKSLSTKAANPSSCSSSSRGVAGEASGGGAEAEPPRTAEQLARLASAAPSEWLALVGCEGARQKACEAAAAEARELRTAIAEAARNPLDDFAPRAERLIANTLRVYDASSSRFVSRRSHAAKREAVSRAATAEALRLTRQQRSVLFEDALATFRAELVLLMAAAARYDRASTRLSRKTTRRFERAVRAATPAHIGTRPQGVALQRRCVRRLRQHLLLEAAAHEAEAAAVFLYCLAKSLVDRPALSLVLMQAHVRHRGGEDAAAQAAQAAQAAAPAAAAAAAAEAAASAGRGARGIPFALATMQAALEWVAALPES